MQQTTLALHLFLVRKLLKERPLSFPIYFGFSASKSFGIYGLRLGALVGLLPKATEKKVVEAAWYSTARGTYSCPNNGAMGPLASLLGKKEEREEMRLALVWNTKG